MTQSTYPRIDPRNLESMAANLRIVRAALRVRCAIHHRAPGHPCYPPREDFPHGWCCSARAELDQDVTRASEEDGLERRSLRVRGQSFGVQVRNYHRRAEHRENVSAIAAASMDEQEQER